MKNFVRTALRATYFLFGLFLYSYAGLGLLQGVSTLEELVSFWGIFLVGFCGMALSVILPLPARGG